MSSPRSLRIFVLTLSAMLIFSAILATPSSPLGTVRADDPVTVNMNASATLSLPLKAASGPVADHWSDATGEVLSPSIAWYLIAHQSSLFRAMLAFQVPEIPDGMEITSASVWLYVNVGMSHGPSDVVLQQHASSTPLTASDFDRTKWSGDVGRMTSATKLSGSGSVWKQISITDLTIIQDGAVCVVGLRLSNDIAGTFAASDDLTFASPTDGSNKPYLSFTYEQAAPEPYPLAWTSSPPLAGTVGTSYTYTPTLNETATLTADVLPSWATLDDGTISGTPTEVGSYGFSLSAVGPGTLTAWQNWTVEVAAAPPSDPDLPVEDIPIGDILIPVIIALLVLNIVFTCLALLFSSFSTSFISRFRRTRK